MAKTMARFGYHRNGGPPVEQKTVGLVGTGVTFVGSPDWKNVIHLDGFVDPDAERLTRSIALATSAYAYTAIMYRATRVGEPPLKIVRKTDEGDIDVDDTELGPLLEYPALDYDMGELLQITEVYRLVTGAALWIKNQDVAGRTAAFVPYSGDEFQTESADGRIYGRFIVETAAGPRRFTADEVVHFREVNPASWRKNLSKLDVALASLDLGHQINRTVRNFVRKALFPGGIISPDKEWNPDDDSWQEWKNSIEAWQAGPANAGAPLVVQGGTTMSTVNNGLKDMLPEGMLDRIEAVISSVFGVPPVVLGWKVGLENSPWSQMSEARLMTYEDTIVPRWVDFEKKLTRQLLTEEQRESGVVIKFDTDDVRALMADDQILSSVASTMRDEWTRNERRVYTGMEPLPDDDPRGDEIGSSMGIITDDEEDDDTEDVTDEDVTDDEEDEDEDEDVEKMLLEMQEERESLESKFVDTKDMEWVLFDLSTKASESSWERAIAKALSAMQRDIIAALDREAREKDLDPDSLVRFVAVVGDYIRKKAKNMLRKTTYPLVVGTGTSAVKRAAAQTGLSFTVLQPGLLDYAAEEAAFLAEVMGNTTGKAVAKIVQRVLNEGGTIGSLRKALQTSGQFSRSRAKMIARTETTRAWNGAQRRSLSRWQEDHGNGAVVTKSWLSARDDRVRPEHVALDGETIKVNERFSNGLTEPGEPNCRCTLVYDITTP